MRTWPTIGRDDEIAAVISGWSEGCVVLRGAPGSGKTRLARVALEALRPRPSTPIWVSGTRTAASIPLGAFAGVVPLQPAAGLDLTAAVGATIAALVANSARPTLVVDDAHLLDAASATVVHALAQDSRVRLLVVVDDNSPAPDSVVAITRRDDVRCVELPALSPSAVVALAETIVNRHVDRLTGMRLWELSQGTPLVVTELLLAAEVDTEPIRQYWQFTDRVPLSPALQSFVADRIATCNGAELYVMRLLAIAESLKASTLAVEREGQLVDGLVERSLLRVANDDGVLYLCVGHPLVAATLRDRCPPMTAFQIKERLLGLTVDAARPDDVVRRVDWKLETAQDVSAEDLRAAVQIVVGPSRDRPRMRRFGRELMQREQTKAAAIVILNGLVRQGRAEEALDLVETARNLPGTVAEQGDLAFVEVDARAWIIGDLDRARLAVRYWKDEVGEYGCFAEAHFAMALACRGELNQASAIAQPLLDHPDRHVQLRAVTPATAPMLMAGETKRVLDLTADLIDGLHERPDPSDAPLYVGAPRVLAMLIAGDLAGADTLLTLATMFWAEGGDSTDHAMTELGIGRLRLLQGRPRAAAEVLRDAASHFSEFADYGRRAWSCALLAEALALTGDVEAAKRAADAADEHRDERYPLYDLDTRRALAWVLAADGRLGDAREALTECADAAQAAGMLPYELMARYDALRLGASNGSAEFARLAKSIDGHWPGLFLRHSRFRTNPAELERLSNDFATLGANLFAAEASAQAGEHFRRTSCNADATRAFARAAELKAHCDDARTPALLTAGRSHPLTGRESEIALMAGRGAPAKTIAVALGLSARTVDNTLGRVYAKLGVRSRAELVELFRSTE